MATSKKDFKKKAKDELELPSGNTVKAKRPGLPSLLNGGILPDELTPIVRKMISSNKGEKPEEEIDEQTFLDDPQKLQLIMDAYDRIWVECVKDPDTLWHRREVEQENAEPGAPRVFEDIPEGERNEDDLYTDEIDMTDKLFVFQYVVGGTRDLRSFREQFGERLAGLEAL